MGKFLEGRKGKVPPSTQHVCCGGKGGGGVQGGWGEPDVNDDNAIDNDIVWTVTAAGTSPASSSSATCQVLGLGLFLGELYKADFGSDWLDGKNLNSRPTIIIPHDVAADTIVP